MPMAAGLAESWPNTALSGFAFNARLGDQEAGGQRDDQGRDLADQAVADGQVEYVFAASPNAMPDWATPMIMPPIRLIEVIKMPAMASPRTNLLAPSMAPKKLD
jgi:hypothetical protein